MTDRTDIDKLRELEAAATPAPWEWSVTHDRQWAAINRAGEQRILAQLVDDDDAEMVVATRNALPALLAELVGLRTEVDQLRTGQEPTCGREGHHLAHGIPMTLQCPGIGEQVCHPDTYQHVGPWEHVKPFQDVERCVACGTEIGK